MNLSLESRLSELWVGKLQSVKGMSVIPLCSDVIYDAIADPKNLIVEGNTTYGQMRFRNESDKVSIVPANFMTIVKSRVQDHAMSSGGFVESATRQSFDNACCIQSSQSGYIKEGMESEFNILPLSLRGRLTGSKRQTKKYDKLWGDIEHFNQNVTAKSGAHLEYFFKEYKDELDEFIMEFEPVENQVGALIFFGNDLVGIEIAPTYTFWDQSWQWLIRGCYGSEFIRQSKLGNTYEPLKLPELDAQMAIEQLEEVVDIYLETMTKHLADNLSGQWKMASSIYQQKQDKVMAFITTDTKLGDVMFIDEKPVYISIYNKSIDKRNKVR